MKLQSKYFDSIRIARRGAEPAAAPRRSGACMWKGCSRSATHRAPKGRGDDGDYYHFCIDHVRQFNASYNYFEGMSKTEVEDFQKASVVGHRPTWRMGDGGTAPAGEPGSSGHRYARFARRGKADAHDLFDEDGTSGAKPGAPEPRRSLRTLERRALDKLDLPETATKAEVKARFKALVKVHHPDANGGDRGSEEKLREIIQAYNYLKQAGLV